MQSSTQSKYAPNCNLYSTGTVQNVTILLLHKSEIRIAISLLRICDQLKFLSISGFSEFPD